MDKNIEKIINDIVWWIPVNKWRDNFRNKMLNTDQTLGREYIYNDNNNNK